jgi:L-lactate dehydrogenase complex protein LldE
MVSDKARCVMNSKAEVCAAIDNSCLMQIGGTLSRMDTGVRTMHIAEILAATEASA